ncbi:MAG: hypothetical protein SGARI_006249, partial [Bacillariaceae sp.]
MEAGDGDDNDEIESQRENPNSSNNDNHMGDFLRDFREAKASKLGGFIPKEQLKESAAQAESDFLQAMKETKDEFNKAKKDLGSEGAVNMLLDRLRQADDEQQQEEHEED